MVTASNNAAEQLPMLARRCSEGELLLVLIVGARSADISAHAKGEILEFASRHLERAARELASDPAGGSRPRPRRGAGGVLTFPGE